MLWRVASTQVSLRLQPITGNTEVSYVLVKIPHPFALKFQACQVPPWKLRGLFLHFQLILQKEVVWKIKGKISVLKDITSADYSRKNWMLKLSFIHLASHRSWYTGISWIVSDHYLNKASPIWNPCSGS